MAARPHGSHTTTSRDWSMGPHEPYWRTNSSFSPPPARWDFQLQPESLQYGSHDGTQLYRSSTSSNSKESRSWVRGNQLYNHPNASDGAGIFLSGSSDVSQGPQWTPPAIQEIRVDDFESAGRRGKSIQHCILLNFSHPNTQTKTLKYVFMYLRSDVNSCFFIFLFVVWVGLQNMLKINFISFSLSEC